MKASLRGTQIYFDVAGMQLAPQGKQFVERPILFMLHGGPGGDHLRFKQHSLELQEHAQLVMVDHRGCGRSKKTKARDYTLENNIEDIEALRCHLGLDTFCLLGTSYGGIVAQGYATRYPKRVEKLILVATIPSHRFLKKAKQNLQQRGTAQQIAWSEHLWKGNFKSHKQIMAFFNIMNSLYCVKAKQNKWTVSSAKNNKLATVWSHEALNEWAKHSMRDFDFIPRLKKINCPTLILAGQDDWICDPEQAKEIAKHIPHSQLKIFKHCSHAIAVDAHANYIQAISRFLKQSKRNKKSKRA